MQSINPSYKIYTHTLLLIVSVCNLALAANQNTPTATQPDTLNISAGQIVAENPFIYRKVIEVTTDHRYKVQNFYKHNHHKQSDILTITDPKKLSNFQELQIYNLTNLIFDGPLTLWFENGNKSMSFNVIQGKAEGPFNSYYMMTGNKEIEGYYYAGKPDGVWKYWTDKGALDKEVYYQAGIIQWQKDSIEIKGL